MNKWTQIFFLVWLLFINKENQKCGENDAKKDYICGKWNKIEHNEISSIIFIVFWFIIHISFQ